VKSTIVRGAIFAIAAACVLWVATSLGGDAVPTDARVIFWASQPVRPGELVMLYGGGFRRRDEIEVWRIPDRATTPRGKPSLAPPQRPLAVKPVQASESCVKFLLPAGLKPGLFACRVHGGASNTALLNRPDAMWLQGDAGLSASPGGWVRVLGNCLSLEGGATKAIIKGKAKELRLAAADVTENSISLGLPKTLPPGEYEVLLHNGYGGALGWSEALPLTVKRRAAWKATVFNVRDFGATGSGDKDDTAAIKTALAKAERNRGGVVYFPRGRYSVSETLEVPRFTVLKGEAREMTALFWPDREQPLEYIVHGTNSFGLEDLTINCYNYQQCIAADLGNKRDAGDVFLRRLRVRAMAYRPLKEPGEVDRRLRESLQLSTGAGDTVRMGGRNVEITDCDLYGSGRALFLSRVRGGYVARNVFRNGRWGWYCISGSDGLVFEHNEIAGGDLMSTGGGLNCLDGSSYSQNVYFAHNQLHDLYGWDREALTSDAGGGAYFGGVTSVEGNRLTLANEPRWGDRDWTGAAVFILDGRGAGQYRRIAARHGRQVTLDRPWDVAPDESSAVSVTMLQRNYLIVGNEFCDATVAVQCYGISIGHIIRGNLSARAGGFHNLGLQYGGGYQPTWFVQYLDNQIPEGNGINGPLNEFPPTGSHIAVIGAQQEPYRGPMARATVMRRNLLLNNARIEVRGMCAEVVIENNTIERAAVGIHVEPTAVGVVLHGNRLSDVGQAVADAGRKALLLTGAQTR
jgi:hypothetical protein